MADIKVWLVALKGVGFRDKRNHKTWTNDPKYVRLYFRKCDASNSINEMKRDHYTRSKFLHGGHLPQDMAVVSTTMTLNTP